MATIYPRGEAWYLSWSEGGEHFRRSLGKVTRGEAERIRSAKEAELTHGVQILPRLPALRDFMDWYVDWYEADHPTTTKKLKSEIKPLLAAFGHRPVDTIQSTEIESWRKERLKTHARETVGKEIRRFKAACKVGIRLKVLTANPFVGVTAPRGTRSVAVRFYTAGEVGRLAGTPHGALWRFMACTGIRRGEAVRVVQSKDVVADGARTVIRVESLPDNTGQGRTKSGEWREIPLNAAAEASLMELPDRIADCHPDTLGDWFTDEARAIGLGGTLHRLRHTFISHLVMAGVPLRRVQLLAGHEDYSTTEKYAHLAPAGTADTVGRLQF